MRLATRILGLAAFLGGPLFVSDHLRESLGRDPAFAIAFAPLALLLFGTLTAAEEGPDAFSRVAVAVGGIGAVGLLAMNAFAAWSLLSGVTHPNATMIAFGIVAGFAAVATYAALARRFFGPAETV
jgi:hypothetical protein